MGHAPDGATVRPASVPPNLIYGVSGLLKEQTLEHLLVDRSSLLDTVRNTLGITLEGDY